MNTIALYLAITGAVLSVFQPISIPLMPFVRGSVFNLLTFVVSNISNTNLHYLLQGLGESFAFVCGLLIVIFGLAALGIWGGIKTSKRNGGTIPLVLNAIVYLGLFALITLFKSSKRIQIEFGWEFGLWGALYAAAIICKIFDKPKLQDDIKKHESGVINSENPDVVTHSAENPLIKASLVFNGHVKSPEDTDKSLYSSRKFRILFIVICVLILCGICYEYYEWLKKHDEHLIERTKQEIRKTATNQDVPEIPTDSMGKIAFSRKDYNEFISIFEAGSLNKLKAKMKRENISPNAVFCGEDYENIDASLIAIAASYTSNVEIIKFLILESADIHRRTTGFRDLGPEMEPVTDVTVLMKASIGDRPEIVKALLDAGVDVNAKDSEKMTALDWALEYSSSLRVIKLLLDAGADAKNSLQFAFSGMVEGVTPYVLRMLIEAGAEVKGNDELLMVAANSTEYPEVIEILLNAGMNAKAKFDRGESKGERAIDLARENPHLKGTKALKMLEEASYENDEERLREKAEKKAVQKVKFQKILRKAENGDVDAQSNLAFMYLLGSDGVVLDGEKAVYWFKKAAAQGDMGSTVQLGVIYRNGSAGVKKDDKEAEIWEQKTKKIIQERNGFKANASDGFQTNASITGDKVNIRTKPNTSSKVVKQLNAGHPVKATKQTNAKDGMWYFIETASGTRGWVFGKYLKLK